MGKITITLTLDDSDADHLVATLKIGAQNWYGHGLASDAARLATYAEQRIDAARLARGRARRKKETTHER